MTNQLLSLLKRKDFSILFLGQFISKMGSAINTIGISLCVLKFDNPVLGMGTLSLLLTIPWIIFGPIAGVFADRYSKKQTIIVCDIISGLLSLALFFTKDMVLFYLIVFLMTIFNVIFSPAISGFLPFVVDKDELESANSIYSGSGELAYLIGPAIGGILVASFGGFPILCSNYIVNELGASDQVYGIFMSIKSIGSMIGALLLPKALNRIKELPMMILGTGIYGGLFILFSAWKWIPYSVVIYFSIGVVVSFINVSYGIFLQKNVDKEYIGRVFSLDMSLSNFTMVTSIVFVTFTGNFLGTQNLMIMYAVAIIFISLIGLLIMKKLKLNDIDKISS